MAARTVYTERFLVALTPSAWTWYTVPANLRAIIMSIAAVNTNSASEGSFYAAVQSFYIAARVIPALGSVMITEPRIAVYGGEQIGASPNAAGIQVTISGYLFEDRVVARAPRSELGPAPEGRAPMPS